MNKPDPEVISDALEKFSRKMTEAAFAGDTQLCLSLMDQHKKHKIANGPDQHQIYQMALMKMALMKMALMTAATCRQVDTTMALLGHGVGVGVDIKTKGKNGEAILHWASAWPVGDYVKLIAMGAEVNVLSKENISPLHLVNSSEHANALLLAGAHPNTKSNLGQTPLSHAVAKNNWQFASLLVAFGARYENNKVKDARWKRLFSLPPLHAAAYGGHTEIALKMIEKGADPTERFLRKTPAQFALKDDYPETAAVLQAAEARFAMDELISRNQKKSAHQRI